MKGYVCCSEANGIQHKIAGIIIKDRRFLAVRKENKKEFIIPGGGHEVGETHENTLRRELKEELLVDLLHHSPLGVFRDKAIWTNEPLLAHIYFVEISGEPCPSSEIVEHRWLDKHFKQKGFEVGSILEFSVIPKLVKRGLM
jgi:ADP-ribose pyrophosphatase YjhB (NUDIX family)